jgi:transposase
MNKKIRYVGLDVHKRSIAIAVAEGRGGEPQDFATVANDGLALGKELARLKLGGELRICYEAGPTGYGLARELNRKGYCCVVVAPSLVPKRPGDKVKTDRRDARKLARFLRSGDLHEVKIPAEETEAMRDLVRAREDAKHAELRCRHQLDKFLLRHGKIWSGVSRWTQPHRKWIREQQFALEAQRRVLADAIDAMEQAAERVRRLEADIESLAANWALAPVVTALQAARGVAFLSAVTIAAEIGDFVRFPTAPQFMAFVGLNVSESSSGESRRQGKITRTGNSHVRRILVEAAWHYRHRPRTSKTIETRRKEAPPAVREIAKKAESRLHKKYEGLLQRNKRSQVAITAVARELAGFVWAIARQATDPSAPPPPMAMESEAEKQPLVGYTSEPPDGW